MKKERELVCIVCPRGCNLKVCFSDSGELSAVEGNACKRGESYAKDECTNPKRTVTSTVRHEDGDVVAVKTSSSVPKSSVFEVMRVINSTRVTGNIEVGDIIVENICGTGADVVATAGKTVEHGKT